MASDDYLDEVERQCHEAITQLRLSFEQAAKPYYDQLARIADLRPQRHTITLEQARELGLLPSLPSQLSGDP